MTLGTRLKEERQRLQLTQVVFAEKGGVGRTAQKYFERDVQKPGSAYLENLSRLGVDVQYVLTGVRRSADQQAYDPDAPVPTGENLGEMARAIGSRLQEWRTARRNDKATLAALIGTSEDELARIEFGRAPLRWATLCKIAEIGLSIDWLLWDIGEP